MDTPRALTSTPPDFSLVLGGPPYQLFRRAHLSGDALGLVQRRIVVIALLAWLPLALLSWLGGRLLPGTTTVPFLLDVEVHIRYLLAVPLLVAAELVVHQRMRPVLQQFLARDLIPVPSRAQFGAAFASLVRWRNSVGAEVTLIALVYGLGVMLVWRNYGVLDANSWYATSTGSGTALTTAGWWYGYVSVLIFRFLLLRWHFRIFLWARFLWQVSRIELRLLPLHPDRVGGLGFLANTAFAFVPLALAHGAAHAAMFANRIFHGGAKLADFRAETRLMVLFVEFLVFGPMLAFAAQLARAKRRGLSEYGTLATRCVGEFDAKWLRGGAPAGEPLVGGASLLPLVPLFLTVMPWDELVRKLFGILF